MAKFNARSRKMQKSRRYKGMDVYITAVLTARYKRRTEKKNIISPLNTVAHEIKFVTHTQQTNDKHGPLPAHKIVTSNKQMVTQKVTETSRHCSLDQRSRLVLTASSLVIGCLDTR